MYQGIIGIEKRLEKLNKIKYALVEYNMSVLDYDELDVWQSQIERMIEVDTEQLNRLKVEYYGL